MNAGTWMLITFAALIAVVIIDSTLHSRVRDEEHAEDWPPPQPDAQSQPVTSPVTKQQMFPDANEVSFDFPAFVPRFRPYDWRIDNHE